MKLFYIITTLAIMLLVSCARKKEETVTPASAPITKNDTSTSYSIEVKPITDKYCISCHAHQTYIRDLSTYEALKSVSDAGNLNDRLFVKKDMPPQGSQQPSAAELEIIKHWISEGCHE